MTREADEKGQKAETRQGTGMTADFPMSLRGQGLFCVQKWFRTGLRAREERARGAGSPRDRSTLHLPVGVSLWKSISELKPNKKVN